VPTVIIVTVALNAVRVTAGIDLTLALIERDLGREIAMRAARLLVVFLKRAGGQSQFSEALSLQSADHVCFADLHEWVRRNLSRDLRIERLAEFVGMTPRTFSRLYVARFGRRRPRAWRHSD
jgi:transcriptional regulator GlxA family with amidase domain